MVVGKELRSRYQSQSICELITVQGQPHGYSLSQTFSPDFSASLPHHMKKAFPKTEDAYCEDCAHQN